MKKPHIFIVFLFMILGLFACSGNESSQSPSHAHTVTLSIPDMDCITCPLRVETGVRRVDGVFDISASFELLNAVITYDPEILSIDDLVQAVRNTGFAAYIDETL
jgi:copper chaperone CopZ